MKEIPLNLIISLKKFDKFGAKIKSDLKYPNQFDLNDYIGKEFKTKGWKIYELYSVINHEGKYSHKGHYNSYVKNSKGNWYSCDDEKVKKLSSESKKSSEKAYILFYRLVDSWRESTPSPRKISSISTQICQLEDSKISKGSNSKSRLRHKRKRIGKISKTSEKSHRKQTIEIISCALSEVSDWTSSSSKRLKIKELEDLTGDEEVSLDI